jgi:hypothetical protein
MAELKKELQACIESIWYALLEAKSNLHIWLEIYPTEAIVRILNRYKGFFVPTMIAHRKMVFVNLYKMLDKRRDSYHFNCLFDLLEKLENPTVDIADCRKRIDEHAETIKHLQKHRHKLVSHIDKDLVPSKKRELEDQIDPEVSVTIGMVKALIKTLEEVLYEISVKTLRNRLSFKLDRAKDPEQIIMIIGAAMAAKREENELELKYIYPKKSGVNLLDEDNKQ